MKKRILSMILVLCMTLPQIQTTVSAASKNFNDEDVTWLGTEKEYKKTLEVMFDYGLRKVSVGDTAKDGSLTNIKYGLVDSAGKFAAEPIYDEIKAYYISVNDDEPLIETVFIDGYVQAIRDGKMGLLDTKGKEVIPCRYDAVGLPVEGISRIIKKSGNKYYLGYWNLELGKEIVKPNKYVVSGADATAEGYPQNYEPLSRSAEWEYADERSDYYKNETSNRIAAQFDFNKGYALVPTGKVEKVNQTTDRGITTRNTEAYLIYAQIIDKKGKEILSGGPYPYRDNGIYPQAGPYMVYHKLLKEKLKLNIGGSTITFYSHLVAGVVGKKGVIIPAQYHGGIRGNSATGWFPADANMQIIPEFSLVMTAKDVYQGKKEDSARFGVVNLNNKTVVPFENSYEWFRYDSALKFFTGNYVYRPDGTKLPKSNLAGYDEGGKLLAANGYFILCDEDGYHYKGVVSIKTGKVYNHENLHAMSQVMIYLSRSNVSAAGTIWINKGDAGEEKWGLVNLQGKVLLPFEYEDLGAGDNWERKENGYAVVEKNGMWGIVDTKGKEILPCKYWYITEVGDNNFLLRDHKSGKYGVFNRKTGKMVLPCNYEGIYDEWVGGTFTVKLGPSLHVLMNDKGKELTLAYLTINTSGRGLFFNSNGDYVGPDGKIVFPRSATVGKYNGNRIYYGEDLTLVVKDGKVGYINASRLARKGQPLPTTPLIKLEPAPLNTELKYRLVQYPYKQVYKIGEPFEIRDFIVHSEDIDGVRKVLDNSKIYFMVSGTVKVTDGYKFTVAGIKKMECYYDGVKTGFSVEVMVLDPASTGDLLDNGTYTIGVYGKYLKIVNGYIELWDTIPADKFIVKLINYDEKLGPRYIIMTEDGQYLAQGSSSQGDQLIISKAPHVWRINKYSKFCTIRDYGKQKLLVNASGQKSSNGTKIIIWSSTGSAPENAKLIFTPVKG
jgi:hypothetical protein